jgi:hypothetical protein
VIAAVLVLFKAVEAPIGLVAHFVKLFQPVPKPIAEVIPTVAFIPDTFHPHVFHDNVKSTTNCLSIH